MNYNSIMNWISTFPIKSKKITQSPITKRNRKTLFSHDKVAKSDNKEKEGNKVRKSNTPSPLPTTEQFKAYGSFLFLCKRHKRDWFLEKHYAKLKDDESGDIVLIYPEESKSEKVKNKLNQNEVRCFVCGNKNHYISHHIIPHSYRQYFPEKYKNPSQQDIVILCDECHTKLLQYEGRYSLEIHEKHNIKPNVPKVKIDNEIAGAMKAANALLNKKDLSEDRIKELQKIVKEYLKKDEFDESDLQEICKLNKKVVDSEFKSSQETIIEKICNEEGEEKGITEFVKDWRRLFVNMMNPQFLPAFWSIENSITK